MKGPENASNVEKTGDMVQVHGRVPVDLYVQFQQMAYEKHPLDHCGAIRREIERAMRLALAAHTHTKTQKLVPSPAILAAAIIEPEIAKIRPKQKQTRVERMYASVMEYLETTYSVTLSITDPEKPRAALVSYAWFKDALNAVAGIDPRTFEKWSEAFELQKFIAPDKTGRLGDTVRIKMVAVGHRLTEEDERELAQIRYEAVKAAPLGGMRL